MTSKKVKNKMKMEGECVDCGETDQNKLTIHHIIPTSEGGSDDKENLELLCKKCHPKHHNKEKDTLKIKISFCRSDGTNRASFDNYEDALLFAKSIIEAEKLGIIKMSPDKRISGKKRSVEG